MNGAIDGKVQNKGTVAHDAVALSSVMQKIDALRVLLQ